MIFYILACVALVCVLSSASVRDNRTGLALSLVALACVITMGVLKVANL